MARRVPAVFAVCLFAFAHSVFAQGALLWGEIGNQQSDFGARPTVSDLGFGGGLNLTLGGDSGQTKGFAVPVGFEFRSDRRFKAADLLAVGDLAFRIRSVSFGPGANFGIIFRPDLEDVRCLNVTSSASSCYTDGTRDIGAFFGFGFSGFVKGTFGPQGRAFIQGRYIEYHKDWMTFMSTAQLLNVTQGTTFDVPRDFPEFESGHDFRLSGGWIFGGGDRVAKVVRAQYTLREFDFTKVLANSNGMFDQRTQQLSFGFGITF